MLEKVVKLNWQKVVKKYDGLKSQSGGYFAIQMGI